MEEDSYMVRIRVCRRPTVGQPTDLNGAARSEATEWQSPSQELPGSSHRGRSSAFGKYAGIIPSSEQFMREKQREVAHEDGLPLWLPRT